jgi:hypothetical protein
MNFSYKKSLHFTALILSLLILFFTFQSPTDLFKIYSDESLVLQTINPTLDALYPITHSRDSVDWSVLEKLIKLEEGYNFAFSDYYYLCTPYAENQPFLNLDNGIHRYLPINTQHIILIKNISVPEPYDCRNFLSEASSSDLKLVDSYSVIRNNFEDKKARFDLNFIAVLSTIIFIIELFIFIKYD